jgi:hypothetical protein
VIPEGRGKSRTSGKKSWVERGVGVLAKRSAEGTKRSVVAFRKKKKLITDKPPIDQLSLATTFIQLARHATDLKGRKQLNLLTIKTVATAAHR